MRRIFYPFLAWGLLGLVLFWASFSQFSDACVHRGPGIVRTSIVRRGDPTGEEWEEEVSEARYKDHNYEGAVILAGFGVAAWVAGFASRKKAH